ncbi:hypothetical protein CHS0354_039344 [Potamilus streckersoni]|uniref:H-type lectin domain-containing protein n=1 Tax=Potamilus streckersoni TaxID=2493646 RepID=A0AAE0W761_9BIVA|nr:hypothetical protein CHS0354_039344 [Potamilus streckersoni]
MKTEFDKLSRVCSNEGVSLNRSQFGMENEIANLRLQVAINKDLLKAHSVEIQEIKARRGLPEVFEKQKQPYFPRERCETGVVSLGGTLYKAERLREVHFMTGFKGSPSISYGIVYFDVDHSQNGRISVTLPKVTADGFTARFWVWGRSITYECIISWIACGKEN